jgi:hypothetical protein
MSSTYKHEWHLVTGSCIHCGANIDNPSIDCNRDANVIAMSHRIPHNNVLRTPIKDINNNSK